MKMIRCKFHLLLSVALIIAPLTTFSQYFQRLLDFDSTYDWGWNIFLNSDNSLFIIAATKNIATNKYTLSNIHLSAGDGTILSGYSMARDNSSIFPGDPSSAKALPTGGFIIPATIQTPNVAYLNSTAAIVKLKPNGDTVFVKTYTDTSLHFDAVYTCNFLQNLDYILGGGHGLNTPSIYPAYLIRIDSMGDTIWTRTYQKYPTQWATINTVAPLDGNRILVGASNIRQVVVSGGSYYHAAPWYLVLDSAGNVLRDTTYDWGHIGGGKLYKDNNGGFIHIGNRDLLVNPDPSHIKNFPAYIAHLDTNFSTTWICDFPYLTDVGHREKVTFKQLRDSSYVVVGDCWPPPPYGPYEIGWAAKIDRNGNIVWSKTYRTDDSRSCYLRDVVEKPDGSLVLVGAGYNDSLPTWHQNMDIWLVGVDSNGCELFNCGVDITATPQAVSSELSIYPNPAYGAITLVTPAAGQLALFDITGRLVEKYKINQKETILELPPGLATGLYICRFKADDGSIIKDIKLQYQQ